MRQLFTTLQPISDRLTSILAAKLPTDGCTYPPRTSQITLPIYASDTAHEEIDLLPWLSRCALDGVCQSILGYPSNTLSAAEDDTYVEALRKLGCVIRSFHIGHTLTRCRPLIGNLMKQRLLVALVMPYFSPYWARKVVDLVTASWIPTQLMRDVRELRRVVETMDSGSRKAFSEKKTAFDAKDTMDLQVAGVVSGVGDTKPPSQAKDIMDIMRKSHG